MQQGKAEKAAKCDFQTTTMSQGDSEQETASSHFEAALIPQGDICI